MDNFLNLFKNKKVTIMGLGLLGRGIGDAQFLAECGTEVLVTDLKTKEQLQSSLDILKPYKNITYVLGEHRLVDFQKCDFVIKAAGVPLDSIYIAEARKNNISIEMDASLFAKHTEATLIGITGTRGKSTVTHAIYEILKKSYKKGKVYLGGNVRGMATLPLLKEVKKEDMVVLELDSWQLQGFGEALISPHVSVFTNFLSDHMNYYLKGDKTETEAINLYFNDKAQIFKNQKSGDFLIAHSSVIDKIKRYDSGIKSKIVVTDHKKLPGSVELLIPGEHNRDNMALVYEALSALNIPEAEIIKGLNEFKGVAGRLELIRELNGVKIYNDTNATTADATVVALRAVSKNKNTVLIFGGADKGLDMSSLINILPEYVKCVVLLSADKKTSGSDRIEKEVANLGINIKKAETLDSALKIALDNASDGDVVLFSPAFASFGMFKNEYDRGDQFNEIVKKL